MKALTPILYIKKKLADDRFFREMESRRQEGIITPIRRQRQNLLQQLSTPLVKIFINIYRNQIYQKVIAVGVTALLFHHAVLTLTFNESKDKDKDNKKMSQGKENKENPISRIFDEHAMDE